MAIHQQRNGALFRVHGLVRSKVLDTADIVRDAMLRQRFLQAPLSVSVSIDLPSHRA